MLRLHAYRLRAERVAAARNVNGDIFSIDLWVSSVTLETRFSYLIHNLYMGYHIWYISAIIYVMFSCFQIVHCVLWLGSHWCFHLHQIIWYSSPQPLMSCNHGNQPKSSNFTGTIKIKCPYHIIIISTCSKLTQWIFMINIRLYIKSVEFHFFMAWILYTLYNVKNPALNKK